MSADVQKTTASKNLVVADLPFGSSAYGWDRPLDLVQFWKSVDGQTCVAFANFKYLQELVNSNRRGFRYELIWDQGRGWNPFLAKRRPMQSHSYIGVFGAPSFLYRPQKTSGHSRVISKQGRSFNHFYSAEKKEGRKYDSDSRYPTSVLRFSSDKRTRNNRDGTRKYDATHPSAKPVTLIAWLIQSFCSPGDDVLDPTSGSGTTAVSALTCGRNVTCIEKYSGYFDASVERVRKVIKDQQLDVALEVRR